MLGKTEGGRRRGQQRMRWLDGITDLMVNPYDFIARVKQNLIISFDDDDELIESFITAAINYAESYQHHEEGYYQSNEMSETTKQAVVMLASHFYESRDGSSGGFFSNSTDASKAAFEAVNNLLRLDRNWKV